MDKFWDTRYLEVTWMYNGKDFSIGDSWRELENRYRKGDCEQEVFQFLRRNDSMTFIFTEPVVMKRVEVSIIWSLYMNLEEALGNQLMEP